MAISDRIMTIGSCFSDAIGERLSAFNIHTAVNPAGILYNPLSIHKVLEYIIRNKMPADDSYVDGEITFNFDFHSSLGAPDRSALQHQISAVLSTAREALRNASWLVLTYGTAWVYNRRDTGEVVANCHKVPQSAFTRTLLTTAHIEASFRQLHDALRIFNPTIRIITTISPVRHVKDTLEGNAVSKSILRVATDCFTRKYHDVSYFPAYEIMMDDLRDYRFYKPDMIHPNEVAEDYIWERFAYTYFDDELRDFIAEWKGVLKALSHRPFHPGSAGHIAFLKATLAKIERLSAFVDVETERNLVKTQLTRAQVDAL